jgi:hypothetical protein
VQQWQFACFFVDVEAVMVCALRVNCWSSTHSLCLCQARALRLGCEPRERASKQATSACTFAVHPRMWPPLRDSTLRKTLRT